MYNLWRYAMALWATEAMMEGWACASMHTLTNALSIYMYSFCWLLTWHLCCCSAQEQAAPSCMQHAFMHPTPMHACMHALQSCCVVFTHSCRPCPFLSVDPWWDCWWTPTCLRRDLTCTLPTVSSVKHMHDMIYCWISHTGQAMIGVAGSWDQTRCFIKNWTEIKTW